MFFYLYDAFVSEKKYEEELTKVENRLIELGINGRIEKMSILRNAKELIEDSIKKGSHTIVAVGDDSTLLKVINIVADHSVTIGFIPVAHNSKLAKIFGITDGLEACNILSKRLIKKINLGRANQTYFVASLTIAEPADVAIQCDEKYSISLKEADSHLAIYNLGNFLEKVDEKNWQLFNDKKYLHVVVTDQASGGLAKLFQKSSSPQKSVFPTKKIKISADGKTVPVLLDEQITLKTPVVVSIKPKKISVIVGRERKI